MTKRLFVLLVCLCGLGELRAAEFELGEFNLQIPAAYEGPISRQPMERITQHVFTVPGDKPQPTISVTVIKHPTVAPSEIETSDLIDVSRTHLDKMLSAGTRQYSEFRAEEPREIKIAGYPTLEVAWSGMSHDKVTHAKLYSLTTRKASYLLQVLGPADSNADVQAAIKAFLALRSEP